jgi:hypothetical protein
VSLGIFLNQLIDIQPCKKFSIAMEPDSSQTTITIQSQFSSAQFTSYFLRPTNVFLVSAWMLQVKPISASLILYFYFFFRVTENLYKS